jgi:hypothetical protein
MPRTASAVAAGALALTALMAAPASADAATKMNYSNCTTYRATSHFKHGVGLTRGHDSVKRGSKSKPVTNFKHSTTLYKIAIKHNKRLDADHDGVACEKR